MHKDNATKEEQLAYRERRESMMYFKRVVSMVNAVDQIHRKSVLDVCAGASGMLNHILSQKRTALDKNKILIPMPDITVIKDDFMQWEGEKHDIVLCTQAIEHFENKKEVAEKLFQIAKEKLIVSIPYKWHIDGYEDHNCSEQDIYEWFEYKPTSEIMADSRLICVWDKNKIKTPKISNRKTYNKKTYGKKKKQNQAGIKTGFNSQTA